MTRQLWTAQATALRCPRCSASPGSRCRTASGHYATRPHEGRLVPSFTCPVCGLVTTEATNVASGYCTSCLDWTANDATLRARAAQDELAL